MTSPLFYPAQVAPERVRVWFHVNPVGGRARRLREVALGTGSLDWGLLGTALLTGLQPVARADWSSRGRAVASWTCSDAACDLAARRDARPAHAGELHYDLKRSVMNALRFRARKIKRATVITGSTLPSSTARRSA